MTVHKVQASMSRLAGLSDSEAGLRRQRYRRLIAAGIGNGVGPALVAFGVGAAVGIALFALDKHFGATEKVAAYDQALDKLQRWWRKLGPEANRRWNEFTSSGMVQDMEKRLNNLGQKLGHGDSALYMYQSLILMP